MLRNNRERIKIKQYFIFIATKKENKEVLFKRVKEGEKKRRFVLHLLRAKRPLRQLGALANDR
jgi:hypothetical protein